MANLRSCVWICFQNLLASAVVRVIEVGEYSLAEADEFLAGARERGDFISQWTFPLQFDVLAYDVIPLSSAGEPSEGLLALIPRQVYGSKQELANSLYEFRTFLYFSEDLAATTSIMLGSNEMHDLTSNSSSLLPVLWCAMGMVVLLPKAVGQQSALTNILPVDGQGFEIGGDPSFFYSSQGFEVHDALRFFRRVTDSLRERSIRVPLTGELLIGGYGELGGAMALAAQQDFEAVPSQGFRLVHSFPMGTSFSPALPSDRAPLLHDERPSPVSGFDVFHETYPPWIPSAPIHLCAGKSVHAEQGAAAALRQFRAAGVQVHRDFAVARDTVEEELWCLCSISDKLIPDRLVSRRLNQLREQKMPLIIVLLIVAVCIWVLLFGIGGFARFVRRRRSGDESALYRGPMSAWIKFLTTCPCITLLIGIAIPGVLSVLGLQASGWTVEVDMDFAEYVREESDIRFTEDAFLTAQTMQSESLSDGYEWNLRRLATYDKQSVYFWTLDVFYEAVDESKGIFTPEALLEIKDFEERVENFAGYQDHCVRYPDGPCRPVSSSTNVFFGKASVDGTQLTTQYDGTGELVADIDAVIVEMVKNGVTYWFDKDFSASNRKSRYTRASFKGGVPPIDGVDWSYEWSAVQKMHKKWLQQLYDGVLSEVNAKPYKHIVVSWYEARYLKSYETLETLVHDSYWSIGSFIFVIAILALQVKSIALTFLAIFGVVLSFTTTYYFYHVVLGYQAMSILNFISVFLIIGIAADDVLVLTSTYSYSNSIWADERDRNPRQRMRWAYREAASAMLVTTVTTCGSFFSLCVSSIPVVRSFGWFMGIIVLWNYINVMIILPSGIVIRELLWEKCCGSKAMDFDEDEDRRRKSIEVRPLDTKQTHIHKDWRLSVDETIELNNDLSLNWVGDDKDATSCGIRDSTAQQNRDSTTKNETLHATHPPVRDSARWPAAPADKQGHASVASGGLAAPLPLASRSDRAASGIEPIGCDTPETQKTEARSNPKRSPSGMTVFKEIKRKVLTQASVNGLTRAKRFFGQTLAPCLFKVRFVLVPSMVLLAILFVILGASEFEQATGELEIFRTVRNLGRVEVLRKEIFGSYSQKQLDAAMAIYSPDPVQQNICPGTSSNGLNPCNDQGTCDGVTFVCTCDAGWTGPDCSVSTTAAALGFDPSELFAQRLVAGSSTLAAGVEDLSLYLLSTGDAPVSWSIKSPTAPWLSVTPASGGIPARGFGADFTPIPSSVEAAVRINFDGQILGWQGSEDLEIFQDQTKVGSVKVTAAVAQEPLLSSLIVLPAGSGFLEPVFSQTRKTYRVSVKSGTAQVQLQVGVASVTSGVAVDGVQVALDPGDRSGVSQMIQLPTPIRDENGILPSKLVRIDALSGAGDSMTNSTITVELQRREGSKPNAPELQKVVATNGQIQMVFKPPSDDGGSSIIGYDISATPVGGGRRLQASTASAVPCTPSPCWDVATNANAEGSDCCEYTMGPPYIIQNGVAYKIEITASNDYGVGTISQPQLSDTNFPWVPVVPSIVPVIPSITQPPIVTRAHGSVSLEIQQDTIITGGAIPTAAYVCISNPGGITGSSADYRKITISGLDTSLEYDFTCSFVNSGGASATSDPTDKVTAVALPPTQPSLTAIGVIRINTADVFQATFALERDDFADLVLCAALPNTSPLTFASAAAMNLADLPADVLYGSQSLTSTSEGVMTVDLLAGVHARGAVYEVRCATRNTAEGRTPVSMFGNWSSPARLQQPPVPQISSIDLGYLSLSIDVEWLSDGAPVDIECSASKMVGGLVAGEIKETAESSPVLIINLEEGIEYDISCQLVREIDGVAGSISSGPSGVLQIVATASTTGPTTSTSSEQIKSTRLISSTTTLGAVVSSTFTPSSVISLSSAHVSTTTTTDDGSSATISTTTQDDNATSSGPSTSTAEDAGTTGSPTTNTAEDTTTTIIDDTTNFGSSTTTTSDDDTIGGASTSETVEHVTTAAASTTTTISDATTTSVSSNTQVIGATTTATSLVDATTIEVATTSPAETSALTTAADEETTTDALTSSVVPTAFSTSATDADTTTAFSFTSSVGVLTSSIATSSSSFATSSVEAVGGTTATGPSAPTTIINGSVPTTKTSSVLTTAISGGETNVATPSTTMSTAAQSTIASVIAGSTSASHTSITTSNMMATTGGLSTSDTIAIVTLTSVTTSTVATSSGTSANGSGSSTSDTTAIAIVATSTATTTVASSSETSEVTASPTLEGTILTTTTTNATTSSTTTSTTTSTSTSTSSTSTRTTNSTSTSTTTTTTTSTTTTSTTTSTSTTSTSTTTTLGSVPLAPVIACLQPGDAAIDVTVIARPGTDRSGDSLTKLECGSTDSEDTLVTVEYSPPSNTEKVSTITIANVNNGQATIIWCKAYSIYGQGPESRSQEVTPGTPLLSRLQLTTADSSQQLDAEQLRAIIAEQLNGVTKSQVVVDGAVQESDSSEYECREAGVGRRLVFQYSVQYAVMVQSAQDPTITNVMAAMNAMPLSTAFKQAVSAESIAVEKEPSLPDPSYLDSSLKALAVLVDDVEQQLVPSFAPSIFYYKVNVTGVEYRVDGTKNSSLASDVAADGGLTVPATYQVSEVAPAFTEVALKVTSYSLHKSTYIIHIVLQPRDCNRSCNNGTCNTLTATCDCNSAYQGDDCLAYCPGEKIPCSGYGRCGLLNNSCLCDETYIGADCTSRECPVCQNGGTCVPGGNSVDSLWGCACAPDFYGPRCEGRFCPKNCSNAGDCNLETSVCTCYPGLMGDDCSQKSGYANSLQHSVGLNLVWGIDSYSKENTSKPVLHTSFDFFDPDTQALILDIIWAARNSTDLDVRRDLLTFPEMFRDYVLSFGLPFPIPREIDPELLQRLPSVPGLRRLQTNPSGVGTSSTEILPLLLEAFFCEQCLDTRLLLGDIGTQGHKYTGRVFYVSALLKIDVRDDLGPHELEPFYQKWTDWVDKENARIPSNVGKMLMVSATWTQMVAEAGVVNSTLMSFVGSITFTMAVVLLFTGNVILAVYTTLTILLTVSTLFGILIFCFQWEFGPIQAVGVIFFVGLSVDYCLHINHSYNMSAAPTRYKKVTETLQQLGTAVVGGAVTTVGSATFLWPCYIKLFVELGVMIFCNMLLALLYTFFFLCPVLMFMGPTGNWGSLYAIFCRSQKHEYALGPEESGKTCSAIVVADEGLEKNDTSVQKERSVDKDQRRVVGKAMLECRKLSNFNQHYGRDSSTDRDLE